MPDPLTFGTDGWRDVIADRFTFTNLGRAAQGYAETVLSHGGRTVLVGHDTRFLGREFAFHAAGVLAANGLDVRVSQDFIPTPAISFATRHLQADGAVMITASHNPYRYQGFKLKGSYGGTATDALYGEAGARIDEVRPEDVIRTDTDCLPRFDIRSEYYAWLDSLLDIDAIRQGSGTIVHDAMGGAAAGWLSGWFRHASLQGSVAEVRSRPDPLFGGVNPEPIGPNLEAARQAAAELNPLFVTATDGDGDRLGVVLPDGSYFNSHQIFAVLLMHLHRRGLRGRVVKTFTVSRVIERLAQQLGLEVTETPVGFKHIAAEMLRGDVLIGGEESGGIGIGGHIPERDGILNSLLLLEAVSASGKGLAELFREAEELAGVRHAYDRLDLKLGSQADQKKVIDGLVEDLTDIGGLPVTSIERLDGIKLNLADGAWLLFRASGTEPLLRIYCEAATGAIVRDLLRSAEDWVLQKGR